MGPGTLIGGGTERPSGRAGLIRWSGEHVPEAAATQSSPAGCEAGGWAQVVSSLVFHHIHCGLRRLLRSTLPAVLWVSLIGVPLRWWVGVPLRRWGSHRPHWPHWLLWIRWVWGCWPGARIRWRVLWVHREPGDAPLTQHLGERQTDLCVFQGSLVWSGLQSKFQDSQGYTEKPCLKK